MQNGGKLMPKLKAVLAEIEQQLEDQLQVRRDERSPELGLLRIVQSSTAMARGMEKLREAPDEEAAHVLFRALVERVQDLREIFSGEDPERQLLKMRVAACIDLLAETAEDSEHAHG